jgi:hypothetical protein
MTGEECWYIDRRADIDEPTVKWREGVGFEPSRSSFDRLRMNGRARFRIRAANATHTHQLQQTA